jgi:hypothetical protein
VKDTNSFLLGLTQLEPEAELLVRRLRLRQLSSHSPHTPSCTGTDASTLQVFRRKQTWETSGSHGGEYEV